MERLQDVTKELVDLGAATDETCGAPGVFSEEILTQEPLSILSDA